MRHPRLSIFGALLLIGGCGGSPSTSKTTPTEAGQASQDSGENEQSGSGETPSSDSGEPGESNEFQIRDSSTAGSAHGATESKIKATKTEAAMKFFVIDKGEDKPVAGIVISMQSSDGKKFYTGETDEVGYGEVLVPVGKTYELLYLSLGRKDITAKVTVKNEPNQNIKLTLRYKFRKPAVVAKAPPAPAPDQPEAAPEAAPEEPPTPVFRLDGVTFDTASADLLPESFPRLDSVVEYMTYKKSARIEVAGHTDKVGPKKKNKTLSQKRAEACRAYLMEKGIDGSRIEAVGYGDERPIASNKTDAGRQQNRRIEAREL